MGLVTQHHEWADEHQPAAATQATISRAADAGGRHVAKSVTVSVCGAAAESGIITFVLRDGATGAGTILWSCKLRAPINDSKSIAVPMNAIGTKNTAMTLESTGAGAAGSELTVAITGYTEKENYLGV